MGKCLSKPKPSGSEPEPKAEPIAPPEPVAEAASAVTDDKPEGEEEQSSGPGWNGNKSLFSPEEIALGDALMDANQTHLFEEWPAPGTEDEEKKQMMQQLMKLSSQYSNGGLVGYERGGVERKNLEPNSHLIAQQWMESRYDTNVGQGSLFSSNVSMHVLLCVFFFGGGGEGKRGE